jgi:hypothetical protein
MKDDKNSFCLHKCVPCPFQPGHCRRSCAWDSRIAVEGSPAALGMAFKAWGSFFWVLRAADFHTPRKDLTSGKNPTPSSSKCGESGGAWCLGYHFWSNARYERRLRADCLEWFISWPWREFQGCRKYSFTGGRTALTEPQHGLKKAVPLLQCTS